MIVKIESNIPSTEADEVTDCHDKIICPGFIDTHHHVWQTQLKGRFADQTLLQIFPEGNLQAVNYTPEDVFWGTLAGLVEAVDCGTTTIVDHANNICSADHGMTFPFIETCVVGLIDRQRNGRSMPPDFLAYARSFATRQLNVCCPGLLSSSNLLRSRKAGRCLRCESLQNHRHMPMVESA